MSEGDLAGDGPGRGLGVVRPKVRRQGLSTKDGDVAEEEARLLVVVVTHLRLGRRAAHQQQQGDPAIAVQQP